MVAEKQAFTFETLILGHPVHMSMTMKAVRTTLGCPNVPPPLTRYMQNVIQSITDRVMQDAANKYRGSKQHNIPRQGSLHVLINWDYGTILKMHYIIYRH